MPYKVLVVDDSAFFRRRITDILNADSDLEVIAQAVDGKQAIEYARVKKPDVITMDIEMPVLDGISAVQEIMKSNPIPILMLSTLTKKGADATLRSLEAGAVDYFPKKFEEIAENKDIAMQLLVSRLKNVARSRVKKIVIDKDSVSTPNKLSVPPRPRLARGRFQLVAIGTSTGGPAALQKILTSLPANFPTPILVIQHMPAAFTGAFATRVNSMSELQVKEAENGEALKPGIVYVAPGGMQTLVMRHGIKAHLKVAESEPRYNYKPCIDVTLNSLVDSFGQKTLVLILTGMGADGSKGAETLKRLGASVWAQNEESSIVFGMPQSVISAGLADKVLSLDEICLKLDREV